jgi:hypothetical protein
MICHQIAKFFVAVIPLPATRFPGEPDGTVSSAAFYDPNGLSVTRGYHRNNDIVITYMKENFVGRVLSVLVQDCKDANAYVKYCPSKTNRYHSEIHGSKDRVLLSQAQRKKLAKAAIIESE